MKVKGRLLELDCLRGIAAIFVVIFHFTLGQPNLYLHSIFKLGCTGVELFFMISGFVIFLTIEKTTSYKDFLLSRFARLYPAYWVCVSLTSLAIILWSITAKTPITFPNFKDYMANLTMFQYYFQVKNIDGSYWTLIIELLFYLFILIIYLLKKLPQIEIISLFIVLICLVYGTILKSVSPDIYNQFGYLPIISYFPLFIAGIVFYKIKFYKINIYRCLLLMLCFITQIVLFDSTGKIVFISKIGYVAMISIFFVIFFLYCFNRLQFIVNDVLQFTGKISYSLYLIHDFIAVSLLIPIFTHSKLFHFNFWIAALIITGPIILVAATLINKFIEVPAMRFLKRKKSNKDYLLVEQK
jgi:peptidoglycan/LPS O-acetylase OafA/YrhL